MYDPAAKNRSNKTPVELFCVFCAEMRVANLVPHRPAPDVDRLVALLQETDPGLKIKALLADAGYDSEANHGSMPKLIINVSTVPHGSRQLPPSPSALAPTLWTDPSDGIWTQGT